MVYGINLEVNRSETCNSMVTRFHQYHGANIELGEEKTVAYRKESFANALTFSERPLLPNEIFLVEIEKNERGWSGHMRIGLTQMDLQHVSVTNEGLPQYALPDLVKRGRTWMYGITKTHNSVVEFSNCNTKTSSTGCTEVFYNQELIKTSRGIIPRSMLRPSHTTVRGILPTDQGSRIGVMYIPTESKYADMHFIINGEDQGACMMKIPYKEAPLHAVVDVYGTTKQVRIVQLYGVPTLQSACRDTILQIITNKAVTSLPLPTRLKDYLLYRT